MTKRGMKREFMLSVYVCIIMCVKSINFETPPNVGGVFLSKKVLNRRNYYNQSYSTYKKSKIDSL